MLQAAKKYYVIGKFMYMEIHVFSTLAYENKKEKKGNPHMYMYT